MNPHALRVLEFGRVLDLVAERASSEAGARLVRALMPGTSRDAIESAHARVSAMRSIVESEAGWVPHVIPGVDWLSGRLRLAGAALAPADLLSAGVLLRSSRLTREALRSDELPAVARAMLSPLADALLADARLEEAIDRVVGDDGTVRDDASPELRRLRRELRGSEGALVALLERAMQRLEAHQRVPDMSVTIRNGRYVIPVRREARGAVGGIVHDASASGATLFVEPPAAVEACNRIREMEADELREVERILLEVTDRIRPRGEELEQAAEALTQLDALYARARFAIDFRCSPVSLAESRDGTRLRGARHPLLVAQGVPVVPFDLELASDERTLLVSGPNTGGKTVLLKTIGILSVMMQSGVPVPVDPGSSVVLCDDVFADVGDEQSIEASLSTFSAHVRNIGEILRVATDRSLVLLDELGSGTDPVEGAALGGAVLESLTQRRALTVATTHLGALKELAGELPGIVNASLQFDAERLAPTYLLIKGIPGRSYGLSIARRLALPESVLRRAEERLPRAERDVNALLESLETREGLLADRERQAMQRSARSEARQSDLDAREQAVRRREVEVEREARRAARRYLLEARTEVERVIRSIQEAGEDAAATVARQARQDVEQLADQERRRLAALDAEDAAPAPRAPRAAPELKPGDLVRVHPLGDRLGRLLERRADGLVVALGAVRMTFPPSAVSRSAVQRVEAEGALPLRGDLPEVGASSEIDLRGMRADEIEELVLQALDAAIRADLGVLRIIHGKGTGVLRERVGEMLRKDTRVKGFRLGAWNEGGAGVTVVEL